MQPNYTDREPVAIESVKTASHSNRFPLRGEPKTARLGVTKGEPISTGFSHTTQKIGKLDRHMPNNGILEKIAVVNDFDRNNTRILISAYKFVCRFPDGRDGVLESRSGEDIISKIVSEEHFGKRIQIARRGFGLIKVLGLVDDKADDTTT
jgi:hypothetical protein